MAETQNSNSVHSAVADKKQAVPEEMRKGTLDTDELIDKLGQTKKQKKSKFCVKKSDYRIKKSDYKIRYFYIK